MRAIVTDAVPRKATYQYRWKRIHFLGFGLPTHYREQIDGVDVDKLGLGMEYASGAAVLIRTELLREVGLFESEMFMYLEDADLGWKLHQIGRPARLVPKSIVYHKYAFNEEFGFYEHLERNRIWLLLVYYRWATLVLILPAFLFMECGQLLFAASKGILSKKLSSYCFFLRAKNFRNILRLRIVAQRRRKISDREFLHALRGRIESVHLKSKLLRLVANPVLECYLSALKAVVVW